MRDRKLKDQWNAIPNRGILPYGTEARMWDNISRATFNKYKRFYNWTAAACAVIVLSVSSYHSFFQSQFSKSKITSAITFNEDIRLINLPDGTRVWLNENTQIEYPSKFSDDQRTVTLKGEAFFEVKHDQSRPFIISSGAIKTTVLGTSFNVKAYTDIQPEVSVRTGKVKVESTKNTVLLERGEKATYSVKKALHKQRSNLYEPEWKKVLIDVEGLTLQEVLSKLKTDHQFSVTYLEDDLKNLKLQGILDTRQGFYEMLQTIAFALEIKIRPTGNNSYLISR